MARTRRPKKSSPRPRGKVCDIQGCDNRIHHQDGHTKCFSCLSPSHFTSSHTHNNCHLCKAMSSSSYHQRKIRRNRLLGSPGARSLAQSLVSVATGGAQPSVDGEAGQGPGLRGSGSSSSSSDEESIPESPGSHPTCYRDEEEEVTEVTPPHPSRRRGGSTHTPSHVEGSVVDTGMALQDDLPLGWSAFHPLTSNQVDRTEAPPLPPLSAKLKRMSGERHHKLESTSVGPPPSPSFQGAWIYTRKGPPRALSSLPCSVLVRTSTLLSKGSSFLVWPGTLVPVFGTGVGGVWPWWALPSRVPTVGNTLR